MDIIYEFYLYKTGRFRRKRMSESNIALVTGGNRGIGYEICYQLATRGTRVYMGVRDVENGMDAVASLAERDVQVQLLHLDVTNESIISDARDTLLEKEGRLDILVNNAGVLLDPPGSTLEASIETIRITMEANVYGPLRLCQMFLPGMIYRNYGRIVNLSSGMGQLSEMSSGYPGYRISKTALNAVTRFLAAEVQGKNVLINSMCPGWVHTDMGGENAPRTPAQGADTAVWLATLPDDGPNGQFFRDRQPIPW